MSVRIPEPIVVPWQLKPVSSAETQIQTLEDGRLRLWIRHSVLKDITPDMLVWWFKHMDGTMRIGTRDYPRYRVWHPLDHVSLKYISKGANGEVGVGTVMRITEAFGRNPKFIIDSPTIIEKLDETGFAHTPKKFGIKLARMDYSFQRVSNGTLYENSLIVGLTGPLSFINKFAIPILFNDEKAKAWLKHNIEEVGCFENFLPELYERNVKG